MTALVARRLRITPAAATRVVIGIDVGGPEKGFHAVALKDSRLLAKTKSRDPAGLAAWCKAQGAGVVAVDAPCRWRTNALARAAEREMAAEGINCYYAPTEKKAREHAFYTWMLPGEALYRALSADYPLYLGSGCLDLVTIETFPHAVACALAGEVLSAKKKRIIRGELIQRAGLSLSDYSSIDEIDAALCALAAQAFASGDGKAYGEVEGGFIIVPATPLTRERRFPESPVFAQNPAVTSC